MAHSLKLNVCIEGVETEEELQEIKEDMKYQKRQRIRKVCWRIIYCNKDENDKIPHV